MLLWESSPILESSVIPTTPKEVEKRPPPLSTGREPVLCTPNFSGPILFCVSGVYHSIIPSGYREQVFLPGSSSIPLSLPLLRNQQQATNVDHSSSICLSPLALSYSLSWWSHLDSFLRTNALRFTDLVSG